MNKMLMPVAIDYYQIKRITPLTNFIKITDYNSLSATPTYIPVFYYCKIKNKVVENGEIPASLGNNQFSINIGSKNYELRTR